MLRQTPNEKSFIMFIVNIIFENNKEFIQNSYNPDRNHKMFES
jgi:hypothetical protein